MLLFGEVLPRLVERDLVSVGDRLDDRVVEPRVADRPWNERAFADRERRIGDEEVRVDLLLRSEPGAAWTRAVRRVEREDARLQLGQRDAVVGARELLAEEHRLPVEDVDRHQPVRELRRRLDRLREACSQVRLHHEPVDDDVDRVLELLVERDLVLEQTLLAVHLHAREPLVPQLLEHVLVLALAVADDRRVDGELRPGRQLQDLVDDRLLALAGDRLPADRTVRAADARVQEPEVVVDLRDRADRRAGVPRRGLLVDRDRRREAVDRVDVRFLHHLEELARIGGEALDIAPLPLGVDRVEGEAGLPGAGEARDADQLVPGQPERDVLEVVLSGTVNYELFSRHAGQCIRLDRTNKCSVRGFGGRTGRRSRATPRGARRGRRGPGCRRRSGRRHAGTPRRRAPRT